MGFFNKTRNQHAVSKLVSKGTYESQEYAAVLSPIESMTCRAPTGADYFAVSPPNETDVDLRIEKRGLLPKKKTLFQYSTADFKRFPFDNFTYCLTLFSKFFSSFPHGTCSLSVSHPYLALEGIYLPFRAAIPNNPTL
jgi:hypothetical protein